MPMVLARPTISDELATELVTVAAAKSTERGGTFTIAIVDSSGILQAFRRQDGCALVAIQVAQDKAYTAVLKGIPTHEWYENIKDVPAQLHGVPPAIERLTIFGGGYPILVDGDLVGGIGISGGHYLEDMQLAEDTLAAVLG